MSRSASKSPRDPALPRALQPGSRAGSPSLQPLSPESPASPSSPEPAATVNSAEWRFGNVSPVPPVSAVEGVATEAGVNAGGVALPLPFAGETPQEELSSIRVALIEIDRENAQLREQAARVRDLEGENRGLRQEVGSLRDALSVVEDQRDDASRRLHETDRRLNVQHEELVDVKLQRESYIRELHFEREYVRNLEADKRRVQLELESVRREAVDETNRLSAQIRELMEELRLRVPRALYDRVLRRARDGFERLRGTYGRVSPSASARATSPRSQGSRAGGAVERAGGLADVD
ncbi:uncharacterized protein SCHCODRAFT_02495707 [Schizophyllum commune H4-8]|nr:uncharacterized protein SCHCODRAFT_02495707 [Schizophyllum commune H4-8]KAI5895173.1 hypothetical protein SCHCODRAFT_02495707 [Schizophyllum commune H4-8]